MTKEEDKKIIYQCYLCRQVTGPDYECCLGNKCYSKQHDGYESFSGPVQTNIRCENCFDTEKNVCKQCNKLYCCDDEHKYIAACYHCGDMFCKEHMEKLGEYGWYCEDHVECHIPDGHIGWYD